jgi:fumarate reductase subunit C
MKGSVSHKLIVLFVTLLLLSLSQSRDSKAAKSHHCLRYLPTRLIPIAIIITITLFIILLVPTLGWLATTAKEATIRSPNTHLTEVVIPSYWAMPNQANAMANIHKPKRPLPAGVSKMTSFGPPFTLDFALNDASSYTNTSSLLPITMDNVFDGTFSSSSKNLNWCPEGEHVGLYECKGWLADQDLSVNAQTRTKGYLRRPTLMAISF